MRSAIDTRREMTGILGMMVRSKLWRTFVKEFKERILSSVLTPMVTPDGTADGSSGGVFNKENLPCPYPLLYTVHASQKPVFILGLTLPL